MLAQPFAGVGVRYWSLIRRERRAWHRLTSLPRQVLPKISVCRTANFAKAPPLIGDPKSFTLGAKLREAAHQNGHTQREFARGLWRVFPVLEPDGDNNRRSAPCRVALASEFGMDVTELSSGGGGRAGGGGGGGRSAGWSVTCAKCCRTLFVGDVLRLADVQLAAFQMRRGWRGRFIKLHSKPFDRTRTSGLSGRSIWAARMPPVPQPMEEVRGFLSIIATTTLMRWTAPRIFRPAIRQRPKPARHTKAAIPPRDHSRRSTETDACCRMIGQRRAACLGRPRRQRKRSRLLLQVALVAAERPAEATLDFARFKQPCWPVTSENWVWRNYFAGAAFDALWPLSGSTLKAVVMT